MRTSMAVEWALKNSVEARNSDKVLVIKVWEQMGLHLSDAQKEKFLSLPDPQSIGRERRKLQEKGAYPATKEVSKARRLKSLIIQQNMPNANLKTADRVLNEQPKLI